MNQDHLLFSAILIALVMGFLAIANTSSLGMPFRNFSGHGRKTLSGLSAKKILRRTLLG